MELELELLVGLELELELELVVGLELELELELVLELYIEEIELSLLIHQYLLPPQLCAY